MPADAACRQESGTARNRVVTKDAKGKLQTESDVDNRWDTRMVRGARNTQAHLAIRAHLNMTPSASFWLDNQP